MKLETLKSSKFEAFKNNEIGKLSAISGGQCWNSTNAQGTPNDSYDDITSQTYQEGNHTVTYRINGKVVDRYDTICTVGPSEGMGAETRMYLEDNDPNTPEYVASVAYLVSGSNVPHSHCCR